MFPYQSGGQRPRELAAITLNGTQWNSLTMIRAALQAPNASGRGESWLKLVVVARISHGRAFQQVSQGQSTAEPLLAGTTSHAHCYRVPMASGFVIHSFRVDEIVVRLLQPRECSNSCSRWLHAPLPVSCEQFRKRS
jgi:hypothetical protein